MDKLHIKYMVSIRCKLIVQSELEKLQIPFLTIGLGEVVLSRHLTESENDQLKIALLRSGLELMEDKKAIIIERIKNAVVEMVHYEEDILKVKNSFYISEKLGLDYTYLSNLFSETTGSTLEHFIISHKIEKVKELLLYDELSLKEISYKLHYSSVAHLSSQFKNITGLTPSYFKKLKIKRIENLENL